jgi:hypothetical protein
MIRSERADLRGIAGNSVARVAGAAGAIAGAVRMRSRIGTAMGGGVQNGAKSKRECSASEQERVFGGHCR